jgi:hypothetical protein
MWSRYRFIFIFVYIFHAAAELVAVQMLSRHGTRAPKEALRDICPAYQNWVHYDVGAEALTGAGMRQLWTLGRDIRARYTTGLLTGVWDAREVFVRSSDSPRCMQSAAAFGHGTHISFCEYRGNNMIAVIFIEFGPQVFFPKGPARVIFCLQGLLSCLSMHKRRRMTIYSTAARPTVDYA